MATAAATRFGLRTLKMAAGHSKRGRHVMVVAATRHRESVIGWSLRQLEFNWRGVRRSDDERALPLVSWARRTRAPRRSSSPSPSTSALSPSLSSFGAGHRWKTRAEMVDFSRRMLARRRCFRRWALRTSTDINLMDRADQLLPILRGRALQAWRSATEGRRAYDARMAIADLARVRCLWARWMEDARGGSARAGPNSWAMGDDSRSDAKKSTV